MKRAIQCVTLFLALITLLTACGSVPSQLSTIADSTPVAYFDSSNNSGYLYQSSKPTYSTREEVLNVVFHEPLVEQAGLKIHYKKERKALIEDMVSLLEQEPVEVSLKDGGLFRKDYFAVSSNGDYYYYGEVKNNRPNGTGILASGPIGRVEDCTFAKGLIYAGGFKKGLISGYGVKFCHDNGSNGAVDVSDAWPLIRDGYIKQEDAELLEVYLSSFVFEEGTWKKGKLSGDVNKFFFYSTSGYCGLFRSFPEGYWADEYTPTTLVQHYKGKKATGDFLQYEGSALAFDGHLKKGLRSGEGTSYYTNGQAKYHGNWKNDLYDGKGTLYDEDGSVIYSGKWKKGDYAS